MKWFFSAALYAFVALPLQAGTSAWSALSGTFPDATFPYQLIDTATPEAPLLAGGALLLETSAYSESMYYLMSGDDIAVGPVTEIRFGLKLGPGASNHDARGQAGVFFTLDPSVGNAVWFNQGQMFLTSGSLVRGPTAAVETSDQVHDYLIRITGHTEGSTVEVYQDGDLKLTGALIVAAAANGPVPRVGFGEVSSAGRGTSYWTHFEHNAYAVDCPSPCGDESLSERSPTFFWCPATEATWYELVLTHEGRFYARRWVEHSTVWTPDFDLDSGGYCWWVRPWGPVTGLGNWSTGCCFSVDTCYVSAVKGLSPDETCLAGNPVTLSWDADTCASYYQLWINRNGRTWFKEWLEADRNEGTMARTLPASASFGRHRWWVRGWGGDGMGEWSDPAEFEIGQPLPEAPAGVSTSPVTFQWGDDCSARAAWYQVWVRRGGTEVWNQWIRRGDTVDCARGSRCYGPVALPAGDYRWWMRAWAPGGVSTWSEGVNFGVNGP